MLTYHREEAEGCKMLGAVAGREEKRMRPFSIAEPGGTRLR
ncbi:hypothetical protein [Bacillus massilinigeriensis]|nr:hypothetical protein [Bacillus mediterraneensis]